ncbi:MAG: helix-turn-helix transcriptional regulator, partial [Firmicutes bacterium]|nr:helix-turn-helix transcriptional regulator [Bacillota bacterium]
MSDIGPRLKRLRENRRMSVKDLAAAVGVSRSFIYQLERGEVSPSYSTLRGIATALGTALPVLVGDEVPEEWLVARRESRRRLVLPATEAPRARGRAGRAHGLGEAGPGGARDWPARAQAGDRAVRADARHPLAPVSYTQLTL